MKNKKFIMRINGKSIFKNNISSKRDTNRYVIIENKIQNYDTSDLEGAIYHCLGGKTITKRQQKRIDNL
jgi:hypothetical protein